MSLKEPFNNFSNGKSWQDKVLDADKIWNQIKIMLSAQSLQLPQTPRRPDVRLIINNISGHDIQFQNPGDHSGSKPELIPSTGDKTAAMLMVKGATLDEQYKNAETLYTKYDLGTGGLSEAFVTDLKQGKLAELVDEAYGPAHFQSQAEKLTDLTWTALEGISSNIPAKKGASAAYGARAATQETVFLAQFPIYVKGTGTTSELVESAGMAIAVSSDWETGKETTRPIVPSVAKIYYGENFEKIPVAIVHPDGLVKEIDLKNGTVIKRDANPPQKKPPAKPQSSQP